MQISQVWAVASSILTQETTRDGAVSLALDACARRLGQHYAAGALIVIALTSAGFLGMTILREIYVMLEHPMGYRR